jgi:hypothetical protein
MTICFGVLGKEGAYLAADTMIFHENGTYSGHCQKIVPFPSGKVAIATTGYLRTLNLIEHHKIGLERSFSDGGIESLTCELRSMVLADGFRSHDEKGPFDQYSCMLVGTPTHLYEIGSVFSYTVKQLGQAAAYGAGMDFALGAWSTCQQIENTMPHELQMCMNSRLRLVISAVFEHCSQTGGRMHIWQSGCEIKQESRLTMTYEGAMHDR